MTTDSRLRALEKTIRPASRGVDLLFLKPALGADCDQLPRARLIDPTPNGKRMLTLWYRADQLADAGQLAVSVPDLIPDGPDHERLVELASDPGQTIFMRYVHDWRRVGHG